MGSGTRSEEVVELSAHRECATTIYPEEERPPRRSAFDELDGPPSRVGRYVVLDVLGVGGMGIVCTAYDPKLNRKVAIKLLRNPGRPGSRRSKTGRARLVREAQALAKLSHPNIVTVHDVDVTDAGRLYIAMEYVEGQTVAKWVKNNKPGWREVLDVFEHAGRGLAAAHAAGIVHRDFKPANVLIGDDGRVRVLDFGLAKTGGEVGESSEEPGLSAVDVMEVISSATERLTGAGRVLGTPGYMAPEQIGGGVVGAAADQFAFAVALFEALYGIMPFSSRDQYADAARGILVTPPSDAHVPPWILGVLRRGLQPDPEQRFPRMADMLAALRADPARRRRRILAGIALVAVAGLGVHGALKAVAGRAEVCAGASERMSALWDETRRDELGEALKATGTSYAAYTAERVGTALDDWASRWVQTRTSVCEATRVHGEQSEPLLDARMACLDRRHRELDALVRVLSDADAAVVERAVGAVHGLRDPSACATVEAGEESPLPADPAERERVVAVERQIDEVEALVAAGRYLDAERVGSELIDAAEQAGHAPTQAKALHFTALAKMLLRRNDEAEALFERAGLLAAEARDPRIEAAAWTKLAYLVGVVLHDPDRGLAWGTAARSAVVRAGDARSLRLDLETDIAAVMLSANRLTDALEHQRVALSLARETAENAHPALAKALGNIGVTMFRLGDKEGGTRHLREALRVAESALGSAHPEVATNAQNLANALVEEDGGRGEARGLLQRALAIRTETFGADHPRTADLLIALALVEKSSGHIAEAEGHFGRALRIYERVEDVQRSALALYNLAGLHRDAGRLGEARAALHDARTRFVEKHGEDDFFVAEIDYSLCQTALREERFPEARGRCERALPQFAKTYPAPHSRRARVELDFAAALGGAGDRTAAREHLASGRRILAALTDHPSELDALADALDAELGPVAAALPEE